MIVPLQDLQFKYNVVGFSETNECIIYFDNKYWILEKLEQLTTLIEFTSDVANLYPRQTG